MGENDIQARSEMNPAETLQNIKSNPDVVAPVNLVEKAVSVGTEAVIAQDKPTQEKIVEVAKKIINNEINSAASESEKRAQDIQYKANQEACRNFGVDESVPAWQQKMMRLGSAFWFIIYFVFAMFTIAPISVFFRGLKTFLKVNWIVLVASILCYIGLIAAIAVTIILQRL